MAQIDVWMALGLPIVDLGQLVVLEATPESYPEKVGLGYSTRLDSIRSVWGRL